MNLSRFKFQAFTNTGFESVLKKELGQIVTNPVVKNIFGKTGVEFRGTFSEMIDIIIYSRTINSLKVVLGHPFHASDVGNIGFNLDKLNFAAFLPEDAVLNDYVRCHTNSIGSHLYHETMLKDLVKARLEEILGNRLQLQKFSQELDQKLLIGDTSQISPDSTLTTDISFPKISGKSENSPRLKNYSKYKKKFEDEIFELYFNLYKDKMCVSLEVFNTNILKTGYKKFIGWGSVKENIISAYLQQVGIIEDFRTEQSVKVFDPFCGSGTILIESILSAINYPIRYENIDKINFNNWPIVAKDIKMQTDMKEYIGQRKHEYNKEMKVSCIGCDISINQLNNAFKNFKHLEDLDIIKNIRLNDNSIIISLKNALSEKEKKVRSFKNKVLLIHSSFIELADHVDKLNGYTLITNIPYGSNYSEVKLNQIYSEFDNFLGENHKCFKKIVILCPNNRKNSYIAKSKYQWNIELDFYNGGYKMGFFTFTPEANTLAEQKTEIIVHERVIKRKRKSDIIVKSMVDLNKAKTPNSRKAKVVLDFAKRKKLNQFLKGKSEYDTRKSEMIKEKINIAEQRKALMMEKKIKELMGDQAVESIIRLIK